MKPRITAPLLTAILFITLTCASALAAPSRKALNLLRQFVAEELDDNLDALADFDLATLEGHPLYGAPGRTFDTDDCNLARAIFDILYHDAFPNLSWETLGTGRPYRGDTLNSFHTHFGRPIPDQPGRFLGLERHQPSDTLRARAATFHSTYHTIGNLAPLPNRSLNRVTLNTYRGTPAAWRDAVPIFLENLSLALLNHPAADATLSALVELNADAFHEFRKPGGLALFAQRLDLHEYVHPATGQPIMHYTPNAHFIPQSNPSYIAAANKYIDVSTRLIQQRAERMITRLRPFLDTQRPPAPQ